MGTVDGVGDAAADSVGPDPGAGDHEQKVGGPAVARVNQGALAAADCQPGVEGGEGVGVQRHDPFGVQLAERHLQPGAVPGQLPQTVQFQVEELAEPQAGAAEQHAPGAGRDIVELLDGVHECSVDVGRQRPGQRCGESRYVAAVQHQGGWPVGPAPDCDVVEERPQVTDGPGVMADRDRASGRRDFALAGPADVVGEELLKVVPPQLAQRGDVGMVVAEPDTEQGQAGGTGLHRLGPQGGGHGAQVTDERVPDDRLGERRHPLLDRRVWRALPCSGGTSTTPSW